MARTDIYQEVTDHIIASLNKGDDGKWTCPWVKGLGLPTNFSTKKHYTGMNVILAWTGATRIDGATQYWGTFNQWKAAGAMVRKGSKGTKIIIYKPYDRKLDDGTTEPAAYMSSATIFNSAQVDGWEAPEVKTGDGAGDLSHIDAAHTAWGATIRNGGDRAYYSPMGDHIQMPEKSAFLDSATGTATDHYYATLNHEHIHWTGHKSRLDRLTREQFGSPEYAFEELVAELGSAFLNARFGLPNEMRDDHTAYITSWLKKMRSDKKAIFNAAKLAQEAVDFLAAKET